MWEGSRRLYFSWNRVQRRIASGNEGRKGSKAIIGGERCRVTQKAKARSCARFSACVLSLQSPQKQRIRGPKIKKKKKGGVESKG